MPSLLGQVQNCCSSSPVTQNEHSVHIGGSGGSKFHLPNPHCETRLHVSSQTPMPDGPDWLACTPEYFVQLFLRIYTRVYRYTLYGGINGTATITC